MSKLEPRIEKLEQQHSEAIDAAYQRVLSQLSPEGLEALAGPRELWAELSDEGAEAIAKTGQLPMGLRLPEGLTEYEPPAWALRRLSELATSEEWRLLGLVEPPEAQVKRSTVGLYRLYLWARMQVSLSLDTPPTLLKRLPFFAFLCLGHGGHHPRLPGFISNRQP